MGWERRRVLGFIVAVTVFAVASQAGAGRLCRHKKTGVVALRDACTRKQETVDPATFPAGPAGSAGAVGSAGPAGSQGTDGSLRIYGNGSAGALTVATSAGLFTTVATDGNLQFTDLTIDPGVTLIVPSGTVFRCTGTFTNNGTIQVGSAARGATGRAGFGTVEPGGVPGSSPAHPGASPGSAQNGELGNATDFRIGGAAAPPITSAEARVLLRPGYLGGGGGGRGDWQGAGGNGGGTLVVLARTAVVNAGTIAADGQASIVGGGGGAGGLVILASPGSLIHGGTISANGGTGGAATSQSGPGGGGAGGIVHFLSPAISAQGVIAVSPGTGGAAVGAGTISANPRSGGGAGGSFGGWGGNGGTAEIDGSGLGGQDGTTGRTLQTAVDPTALL